MSRTVYFKGVGFDSLGLVIRKRIIPPVTVNSFESIVVPDGPTILNDLHTQEPITFSIECDIVSDNLRQLYGLIQGKGILILPDEQDKYYNAVISADTPANIALINHHITLNVTAEPFAYKLSTPAITCTLVDEDDHKKVTLNNTGSAPCEPWYRLKAASTGTMKIWFASQSEDDAIKIPVTANNQVSIDVFRNNVKIGANHIESSVVGNYLSLKLEPGTNVLKVKNCSEFIIVYNERWY